MAPSITRTAVIVGVAVAAGLGIAGAAEASGPSAAQPHTTATPHGTPSAHTTHKPKTAHTTHKPKTAHAASTHRFPAKHAHVHLHAQPNVTSPTVGTVVHAGSTVTVRCYTTGAAVGGDTTWYRTPNTTRTEYVAGADLRSGHDPAKGVPRC